MDIRTRDVDVSENKRGYNYRGVLHCKCMYTVPENNGMSVDSSHC